MKFKTPENSWREFDFGASPPTRFAIESTPSIDTSSVEKQSIMISLRVNDIERVVSSL